MEENNPAFGLVQVTRSSGTPRALFMSDLKHTETIVLAVSEATHERDLHHDWNHPTGRPVVEVEMSLAQWGQVVSSIGLGSGTPVTIRERCDYDPPRMPAVEHEPRMRESLDEVSGTVEDMLSDIARRTDALEGAINDKKGIKAIREALRGLRIAVDNAPSNAEFAVKSLNNAAEHVVGQANSDIEAMMLRAASMTGIEQNALVPPSMSAIEQ